MNKIKIINTQTDAQGAYELEVPKDVDHVEQISAFAKCGKASAKINASMHIGVKQIDLVLN